MTDIRYGMTRDPKWHAMVTATCVLVVDRALADDRIRDLWASVHESTGAQAVLDALTRGGISSTPSFAMALVAPVFGAAPSPITVIVRGGIAVSVTSAAETVQISGEGVSTWVERTVPDALYLHIGSSESTGRSKPQAHEFVLNDGTAPVDWLSAGIPAETGSVRTVPSEVVAVEPPVPPRAADEPIDPGVTITDPTFAMGSADGDADSGYDFLFGETVVRTVEGAAVREEQPGTAGDHDGRTAVGLSAAERRAARQARRTPTTPVAAAAPEFALTFSTGERELLDQSLIIGRAPSASKVSATSVPRLVTVGGPDQDISRNHVQVTVEGGTVLVTDLHSRNGTMVTIAGRPPQQLRGGQPTAVISGAVVDLGSGVSFTVGEN